LICWQPVNRNSKDWLLTIVDRYENSPLKATPMLAMGIRASVDIKEMPAKILEFNNLLFITMSPFMAKLNSGMNMSAVIALQLLCHKHFMF